MYGACVSHANVWSHWDLGNTCGLLCEPMVVVFCAAKIFSSSSFSQNGVCRRPTPNMAPMTFPPLHFPPCLEIRVAAATTKTLVIHSVLCVCVRFQAKTYVLGSVIFVFNLFKRWMTIFFIKKKITKSLVEVDDISFVCPGYGYHYDGKKIRVKNVLP